MSTSDKEAFDRIRKAPTGRSGIFVPEVQLVRERKLESIEKRVALRPIEDIFVDVAWKVFPKSTQAEREAWYTVAKTLRHFEDLDPAILTLAVYLRLNFPLGFNLTEVPERGKLMPQDLNSGIVIEAIHGIIRMNERTVGDLIPRIKADLVAYYNMFFL